MLRTILLLCILLVIAILHTHVSLAWSGKVVGVADGDTITVLRGREQVKVRLYGIDCPEKSQAFGHKAKAFTASLMAGKVTEVEEITKDRYGRTVALVAVGPINVNEEIVKSGFAWVYRKYCKMEFCDKWVAYEGQARNAEKALWHDPDPVPPWEWRRR